MRAWAERLLYLECVRRRQVAQAGYAGACYGRYCGLEGGRGILGKDGRLQTVAEARVYLA